MRKDVLIEDIKRIEEIQERTVNRCDLWQDRCVYWLSVAVWHLLQDKLKEIHKKELFLKENNIEK